MAQYADSLDPMVREWLTNLYTEAIDEAEQSLDNEGIWEKGYDGEEDNPHTENIRTIEQYISVLNQLRADAQTKKAQEPTRKEVLYDAMLGYLVELVSSSEIIPVLRNLGFTQQEIAAEGIQDDTAEEENKGTPPYSLVLSTEEGTLEAGLFEILGDAVYDAKSYIEDGKAIAARIYDADNNIITTIKKEED